ncbi:MAG: sulfatase [Planctomycetota bacterium]|nr:sulfatase [Planctomycetota bacterium]
MSGTSMSLRAILGVAGICLLAGLILTCGSEQKPARPGGGESEVRGEPMNIVLVSIDSVRRDHLSVYGHRAQYAPEVSVSPNLEALAAEGVVFEDAWTTSSWTLPAHMSLMTGLSDRRHGVETDSFKLDSLRTTLAENLQDAGWNTAGYYSGPYLDAKFGFDRGFDDYQSGMLSVKEFGLQLEQERLRRVQQGKEPMTPEFVKRMVDRRSHMDITSPRINQLGKEFLAKQNKDEPFFLFLHYFDAHYDHIPWRMEEGLDERFDPGYDKNKEGAFDGVNWYFDSRVMDVNAPFKRNISQRDLDHVVALYDAEINWVDRHIGDIIQALKDQGQWENTILMVISDHGDEFFDHNSIGHRSTLFAEQCRIPMILRVPGITPEGRRVPEISRIYDVAPTLLDFGGAPDLEEAEGTSLRETIDGRGQPRFAMQRIFSGGHRASRGGINVRDGWRNRRYSVVREFGYDQANSTKAQIAVKPKRRKDTGEAYFVFDRFQDPNEKQPLSSTDPRYAEAINAFCKDFQISEEQAQKLKLSPLEDRLSAPYSEEERALLGEIGYTSDIDEENGKAESLDRPLAPFPDPCLDQ